MVENEQAGSPRPRPPAVVFEYTRRAFDSIQEMVLDDGCRNSPKARCEVAGVLYGTREGNLVRVQVVRRIACEHAHGRAFLLSTNDKAKLQEQLTRDAAEPALQGLAVVGWFLSHAAPIRTAMTASGRTVLSFADVQTFDEYFGTPGQVTLVLRPPDASTPARASVFVRRADGSVDAEQSDLEFPLRERAALSDPPEGVDSKRAHQPAPAVRETALAAVAATAAATKAPTISVPAGRKTAPAAVPAASPSAEAVSAESAAVPKPEPSARRTGDSETPPQTTAPGLVPAAAVLPPAEPVAPARKSASAAVSPARPHVPELERIADPIFGSYLQPRFTLDFFKILKGPRGIGTALVLLVGLALMPLGFKYFRSRAEPVPISLTMSERDRRIQVRWDCSSSIIREAVRGSMEFVDGKYSRAVALSAEDLLYGNVIYMRRTGDVQIRLEVEDAKGQKTQDRVHFIEARP